MRKPRIACVVGTRPDAIKTAPVVVALRASGLADVSVVATGQHREMLDQALDAFGLKADNNLELMRHGQSLAEITAGALAGLDRVFAETAPDYVTAQGDTTTTFAASLAAFYRQIPFGHIEAGLRTHDLFNPFPEEYNRRACAIVAKHHFAPTRWAAANLAKEGITEDIFVTGNTGIDAVLSIAERESQSWFPEHTGRVVLLTTHRRENWGANQQAIARAARRIVEEFPDVLLVVPMHKNPSVRETLKSELSGHERIQLIEPPDYGPFVKLLQRSTLALTDSGGVQEEAPAFGVPALVLRDTTERPEGVEAGTARLIGCDENAIFENAASLLSNQSELAKMANAASPYGDGKASSRVTSVILRFLGVESPLEPMWD